MDFSNLLTELHKLSEDEQFYKTYQQMKRDPRVFHQYLQSLDIQYLLEKHLLVPEIPETMPPFMQDDFFYPEPDDGILIQKHSCYSPPFYHSHTFFEYFYVIEGTCEHEIGNKQQKLQTGDLCIIPPGVTHMISVQDDSLVIVFINSASVLENVFANPVYHKNNILSNFFKENIYLKNANNYLLFHTGNDLDLKQLALEMLLESKNQYAEYLPILYAMTGIFFGKILRYYENTCEFPEFTSKADSLAYGIVSYIQEKHATITLEDVAQKFHYTPEYTSRFIKETTGSTFSELVIQTRLRQATQLLKNSNLPISDVSASLGYLNPESFIRVFKKQYGLTPAAYRKQYAIRETL